jgi:hypothetical protein
MTLQPQNPEDISRNPQLRLQLDRIEAASEDKRHEPGRFTIVFSEGARSDLEKIVLRLTDPEKYREMCDQIEARWAQSWQELARYNPPELRLSVAPQALHMSEVMRYIRYYEDNTKLPSDAPPSLQVLIESPAVNGSPRRSQLRHVMRCSLPSTIPKAGFARSQSNIAPPSLRRRGKTPLSRAFAGCSGQLVIIRVA